MPDRERRSSERYRRFSLRAWESPRINLEELVSAIGLDHRAQKGELDPGTKADALLAGTPTALIETFFRAITSPCMRSAAPTTGQFGGFGNKVDCARKQSSRPPARPRASRRGSRAAEPLTSGRREIVRVLVVALKLCQAPVRLLEVVADRARPSRRGDRVPCPRARAARRAPLSGCRDTRRPGPAHGGSGRRPHGTHQTSFGEAREMSIDVAVG